MICHHQSRPPGRDTGRRICAIGWHGGRPYLGECERCVASGRNTPAARATPILGGPGTELARLLKKFFLSPKGSCKCASRAAKMDIEGPDWCSEDSAEIVSWLEEEARARKLPFSRMAAGVLVRRAIVLARRKLVDKNPADT